MAIVIVENVMFVSSNWTDENKLAISVKKGAGKESVYTDELVYGVNAFQSVSDVYAYTASSGVSPVRIVVYDKALTTIDVSCFAAGAANGDELLASLYSLTANKTDTTTAGALSVQGDFGSTSNPLSLKSAAYAALTGFKNVFVVGTGTSQVLSLTGGTLSVKMNFSKKSTEDTKKGTNTETVSYSGKITNTATGSLNADALTVLTPKFSDLYDDLYSTDTTKETICSKYSNSGADLSVIPLTAYENQTSDWLAAFQNNGQEFCVSSYQKVSLTDAVVGSDVHGGKYTYELSNGKTQVVLSNLTDNTYQDETEKNSYTEKKTGTASGSFVADNLSANETTWSDSQNKYVVSDTSFTNISGYSNVTLSLFSGNTLGSFTSSSYSSSESVEVANTRKYNAATKAYDKFNANNSAKDKYQFTAKSVGTFYVTGVGTFKGNDGIAVSQYKTVSVRGNSAAERIVFEANVSGGEKVDNHTDALELATTLNTKKGVTTFTVTGDYDNGINNRDVTEKNTSTGSITAENAVFTDVNGFSTVTLGANVTAENVSGTNSTITGKYLSENGSGQLTTVYKITDSTRTVYDDIYKSLTSAATSLQTIGTKTVTESYSLKQEEKLASKFSLNGGTVSGSVEGYATANIAAGAVLGSVSALLTTFTRNSDTTEAYDIQVAVGSTEVKDVIATVSKKSTETEQYTFGTSLTLNGNATLNDKGKWVTGTSKKITVSEDITGYKKVSVQNAEVQGAISLVTDCFTSKKLTSKVATSSDGSVMETSTQEYKYTNPGGVLTVGDDVSIASASNYATATVSGGTIVFLTNSLSGSDTKTTIKSWNAVADYKNGTEPTNTLVTSWKGSYSFTGTAKITAAEITSGLSGYQVVEISADASVGSNISAWGNDLTVNQVFWNSFSNTDSGETRYAYSKSDVEINAVKRTVQWKTTQTGAKSVKVNHAEVTGNISGYSAVTLTDGATVGGNVVNLNAVLPNVVQEMGLTIPGGYGAKVQCNYTQKIASEKTDEVFITKNASAKVTQTSGGTFTLKSDAKVTGDVAGYATVVVTDGTVSGSVSQVVYTVEYEKYETFYAIGGKTALENYDANTPAITGEEYTITTTAAGKVTVTNGTVGNGISGYATVKITDSSSVSGNLSAGNYTKYYNHIGSQKAVEKETFTAAGTLSLQKSSSVNGDVYGFLSVTVTDSNISGTVSSLSVAGLNSSSVKTTLSLSNGTIGSVMNYRSITIKSGVNYINGIFADYEFKPTVSIAKGASLSVASFSRGTGRSDYVSEISVKGEFDFTGTASDIYSSTTVKITGSGDVFAAEGVLTDKLDMSSFKGKAYSLGAAEDAAKGFRCVSYETADDLDTVAVGSFGAGDTYNGWLSTEELDSESELDGIFNDAVDNLSFTTDGEANLQMTLTGFDSDDEVIRLMMDSKGEIVELTWMEETKTFSCDLSAGETYELSLSIAGIVKSATNYQLSFSEKK